MRPKSQAPHPDIVKLFFENSSSKIWKVQIFFLSLQLIQSVCLVWAVGSKTYWTSASPLSHTGVFATRLPQTEHKRTFSKRYLQVIKLRKLETIHRDNATVSACVCVLYPNGCFYWRLIVNIIPLGVGWLRCLSLYGGNAKA